MGFHLEIPEFYPEAFSFSPFVREHAGADVEICDWIDNAITVQMGRGEGLVYGYMRVPCRISMAESAGSEVHQPTELNLV